MKTLSKFMLQIKNFSIFKSKPSDNEKLPTHRLSAKVGDNYVDIGACWTKTSSKGDKFLSAKLADVYVDHTDNTKSRKGIVLVYEDDLKELAKLAGVELTVEGSTKPQKPLESESSPF